MVPARRRLAVFCLHRESGLSWFLKPRAPAVQDSWRHVCTVLVKIYTCMQVCSYVCVHVYVCTYVLLCICVYLYVCTYVHLFVRLCVCASVCTPVRLYAHMYVCTYVDVCIRMYVHVCMSVCLSVCLSVFMDVCLYVCVCIYICTHNVNMSTLFLHHTGASTAPCSPNPTSPRFGANPTKALKGLIASVLKLCTRAVKVKAFESR